MRSNQYERGGREGERGRWERQGEIDRCQKGDEREKKKGINMREWEE